MTLFIYRVKVTTCLYLSPSISARSLSTLIAVSVYMDTDVKVWLIMKVVLRA